jgi:hypothetical protein
MEAGVRHLSSTAPWLVSIAAAASVTASAMSTLNPYFTAKSILPAGMDSITGIGGIGLLPNGDGVVCGWGGSQDNEGKTPTMSNGDVWIIPALATGVPGTPMRIATGLREPLGVAVVGNDFYVLEKPRIAKFTGSGADWTKSTLWSLGDWYDDDMWHHFSFHLVYRDDAFWFTTGTAYPYDPDDPIQRGALIKVPLDGSGYTQMARGLRNPDGLGVGPEGEFFATDNQGNWRPANYLYWLPVKGNLPENGRFYGFRTNGNNACKIAAPAVDGSSCPADPEYPPAIWLPYGLFSASPTRPILLKEGPYKGQMISGDVCKGGILRYQLEKVNNEWQGAAFLFNNPGSSGINFGIHQFIYTPDGNVLAIGIGGGAGGLSGSGNWNWSGTVRGLNLLTPTNVPIFDMLAIHSLKDGFDVEFSQPVSASAALATSWGVKTTVFTPSQTYGFDAGAADNNIPVAVSSATLSEDGKHVHIKLASLSTRRMYAITATGITAASGGQALYNNTGYYTLNSASPDSVYDPSTRLVGPTGDFAHSIHASIHRGRVAFDMPFKNGWNLDLLRLDGTRVSRAAGSGPGRFESHVLPAGLYVVVGRADGDTFREKVQVR